MGRQGARLTQVDREHVNVMYKHHAILYTMHLDRGVHFHGHRDW